MIPLILLERIFPLSNSVFVVEGLLDPTLIPAPHHAEPRAARRGVMEVAG